MTHYELLQACRAVRDNLGRKGTISVEATVSEDHSEFFGRYSEKLRLSWTISFHDSFSSIGGSGHVQVSFKESQQFALDAWTEAMRERFGPVATVNESELAATLDAHRVAESAA